MRPDRADAERDSSHRPDVVIALIQPSGISGARMTEEKVGTHPEKSAAPVEPGRNKHIIDHYDALADRFDVNEFYGHSDFMNFGYWDDDTRDQKQACENMMEQLLALIPNRSGTILDVACGKGASTAYLMKYYRPEMVTGINISEKQLQIARDRAPGCTFRVMDATDLDFPDGSIDNVLCVEAAFHFDTREKFLKEVHRVLKPGGAVVLSDILMTLEGEKKREMRTEKNYVKDPADYEAVLKRAGFSKTTIVDATESCWERHFWHTVNYVHRKFLAREISEEQLHKGLRPAYLRVPDIEYYLLVAAQK
jgi:MPBQ/MSBQ methyltransferase